MLAEGVSCGKMVLSGSCDLPSKSLPSGPLDLNQITIERRPKMKTATFVKDVSDQFTGTARLYRLAPPDGGRGRAHQICCR